MKRDALTALLRAIRAKLPDPVMEQVSSRAWASITFSGARHQLCLRLAGEGAKDAADGFVSGLCEADFHLPGHILADIALSSRQDSADGVRLKLEALTVEDA
jgi:hypothetical protein